VTLVVAGAAAVYTLRAADDCLAVFGRETLPKYGGSPGVNLGSNENDAMQIFLAKSLPEGAHFIRGVYDGGRKNMDGAIGNALMKQ